MRTDLHTLTAQVQHNCHISDARHARNYSLCIYLLKMREYFRWEMGFGYDERLPEKQLGDWLVDRERFWGELEEQDYRPIEVSAQTYAPFEPEIINDQLLPSGLVYSGGYGGLSKPHFFLAELHAVEQRHGRRILITGREHARDLTAPPAMTLQGEVYVRRESLRRMLWEKIEEWRWRRQENAMARAIAFYPVETALESALDAMTATETEAVVLHELGEVEAGQLFGAAWEQMLSAVWHTRAELVARAVRDHLADCLTTLPALLEEKRLPSLHFYMANLSGMRQALFPALNDAYRDWLERGSLTALHDCVGRGQEHWLAAGRRLLQAYGGEDDAAAERIDAAAAGIEL
ncbi:Sfum_1244 family protein [Sulfurivermis fontis]|uniref:Sfum_1244 family protein n=1 Tax=Sulfurivermis fontis TaxID=1972068 RepID=UPI000FDCA9CB|nr:Sfum_1244 family protein [Sulfurivermis fontis]